MKIVREEIDYKKQMENNNKNMKKSEETDTVIAVDPTYADAMEQDKKAEEKVGEIMKKKHEEQKSIETPDPSTGKPLKKNMYTKQEELDESLFDDSEGEEVKEEKNPTKLPGDVFTMVYDFIFDGLHKSPVEIKGLEDVEDVVVGAEKYFQDVRNFTNIGVQIKDDEKNIAEYVKKIADALGFSTSEKRYERGVKNGDYVLFVEIPEDVAVMKASRFLKEDESLKEGKKLTETWEGEDIIDRLAEDAKAFISDGNSKEKAIEKAIDEGLTANWDRVILGWHYDVIDTAKIIEDIYSMLIRDIGERLDKEEDEDESVDERKEDESKEVTEDKKTQISPEDIGYSYNSRGFMMYYKGEPIGGAGIGKDARGPSSNVGLFKRYAEATKRKLLSGNGESYMMDAIREIDRKEDSKEEVETIEESKETVKESKKLTEDAKIYISLSDYKPWSGAVDTFEKIRKEDKMDELDAFIEEMYPDGLTDTELNDLLWFEPEYVFDNLGIDYDKDEDEDDEDEDDEIELDFEEEDEEKTDEE